MRAGSPLVEIHLVGAVFCGGVNLVLFLPVLGKSQVLQSFTWSRGIEQKLSLFKSFGCFQCCRYKCQEAHLDNGDICHVLGGVTLSIK